MEERMKKVASMLLLFGCLTASCRNSTDHRQVCGSGFLEGDEQCDDPSGSNSGPCSSSCMWQEFNPEPQTWRSTNPPAVSVAPDGHFVVAYERRSDLASPYHVYAVVYGRNGQRLWGPERLNMETDADAVAPQVAASDGGSFAAVWEKGAAPERDVYIRFFDGSTMEPLAQETRVNDDTAGDQYEPVVARAPGGGAVVAWTGLYVDGDGAGVLARRLGSGGVTLGAVFAVNTNWENDQKNPSVASAGDGRFVIAWESKCQESG